MVLGLAMLILVIAPALAENPVRIPVFRDLKLKIERPDPAAIRTIRFLTESDYPPFHFLTPDGQLTGFEVDLAREICKRLGASCSIQPIRWDGLVDALNRGAGDAIIAAMRISAASRRGLAFSHPYFRSPARFVSRSADAGKPPAPGDRVAVARQSAHEAYLKDNFPLLVLAPQASAAEALEAVLDGAARFAFADATEGAFFLNGERSGGCCQFAGGPFNEPGYFGEGTGIAVRPDARVLLQGLDWALQDLFADGTYARLYLKYFPVGLY